MNIQIIEEIHSEKPELFALFPDSIVENVNGMLCFDGYIPFPIIVNQSYDKTQMIDVKHSNGEILGYIFFSNDNRIIPKTDMSVMCFAAYLIDVEKDDFLAGIDYMLKVDYLVIKKDKLTEYEQKYKASSGLWGGYIHKDIANFPSPPFFLTVTEITATENIELPTNWHSDHLTRSIQQPYSFERFLKQYHLLELLFDWQIVEDIKALGDDIYGAGLILRDYGKGEEINRLIDSLSRGLKDISKIESKLNLVSSFKSQGIALFYTYGKESNPLKESGEDFTNPIKLNKLLDKGGFTEANVKKYHSIPDYRKFIIKLTCYWIYRIRSSIAHAKIGEYQLSYQDEAFMVQFAEPLLKEVLIQCFTKTT